MSTIRGRSVKVRWALLEREARVANLFERPTSVPININITPGPGPGWNPAMVEEAFIAGRMDRRR